MVLGEAKAANPSLVMEVAGRGRVVIELYQDKAPQAVNHIKTLAERKFYDGQRFHRVVREPKPFLVQFGDPLSKTLARDDAKLGTGGTGAKIPFEETGIEPEEGTVGLSHPQDEKNAGDSQFFVLLSPSRFLKGSYTFFGKVTEGMNVVKQIQHWDQVTSVTVRSG